MSKRMRVAILGSGPAGLLAAHACTMNNVHSEIFSRTEPSALHGSQFLAAKVPGLTLREEFCRVVLQGTEQEYRNKVYGEGYAGPVSPTVFASTRTIYDIRKAYEQLWYRHEHYMSMHEFESKTFTNDVNQLSLDFDLIFSSLPSSAMCVNPEHKFEYQNVWASGDAPDLGVRCPVRIPDHTIIYCGNDNASWYRASNTFGHCTVEWSMVHGRKKPPVPVAAVSKPLSTNCNCWPNVIRIGRYGEWKKGVLAFSAFSKANDYLRSRGVQGVLF